MPSRREFLVRLGGSALATVAGARVLAAQQGGALGAASDSAAQQSAASNMVMDSGAYIPVRLPAKANAKPLLTDARRDDLEHLIQCQCGCTQSVYTCRTTDFSCQVSPAMHRDVMSLVEGGYSAQEIINAFTGVYGEKVLLAPKREGFNWLGYLLPSSVLAVGAVVLAAVLHRWNTPAAATPAGHAPAVDATDDELRRLEAAVRSEDDA